MISRRSFVAAASAGAALATGCGDLFSPDNDLREPDARLHSRWREPFQRPFSGVSSLGIRDPYTGRDGIMYVPPTYHAATASPLVVALHGANQNGFVWSDPNWLAILDDFRAPMVAPDSRHFGTWDLMDAGAYGEDVPYIDHAIAIAFRHFRIDRRRIALVGFSAGASEALGLGLMNGDLFSGVVGFAPGQLYAPFARGRTRAFISHGDDDPALSYEYSRDVIAPAIKAMGVETMFSGFAGGHTVLVSEARKALNYAMALQ